MHTRLIDGVEPRPDDAELMQVAITTLGANWDAEPARNAGARMGVTNRAKQVYRVFEGPHAKLSKLVRAIEALNFVDELEEGGSAALHAQYAWVLRGYASRY